MWRIFSSYYWALFSCAGPSGAFPVPVLLAWRRSSVHGEGVEKELEDPVALYFSVLRALL
jgi:hypothetical protein